jgi:hypothetical protein
MTGTRFARAQIATGLALLLAAPAPASAETLFDGSKRSFARWRHAGGAPLELHGRTIRTGPGNGDLGILWYAARRYRDGVRINRYVGSRRRIGYIGLQVHGGPQDVVSFRAIRIRALRASHSIGSPDDGTSAPSSARTEASASRRTAP